MGNGDERFGGRDVNVDRGDIAGAAGVLIEATRKTHAHGFRTPDG